MSGWLLEKFNRWFCSAGGVWQTMIVTVGLVVAEASGLLRDQHGFWLLYWLTVYSAVTQPALAHSGARSAAAMEEVLARLEAAENQLADAERRILARLEVSDG